MPTKLRIAHTAAIVPEVANTLPRLLVLFRAASERLHLAVQAVLIEFLVELLDPWPGRFTVAKDNFAHRALYSQSVQPPSMKKSEPECVLTIPDGLVAAVPDVRVCECAGLRISRTSGMMTRNRIPMR